MQIIGSIVSLLLVFAKVDSRHLLKSLPRLMWIRFYNTYRYYTSCITITKFLVSTFPGSGVSGSSNRQDWAVWYPVSSIMRVLSFLVDIALETECNFPIEKRACLPQILLPLGTASFATPIFGALSYVVNDYRLPHQDKAVSEEKRMLLIWLRIWNSDLWRDGIAMIINDQNLNPCDGSK